MMKLILTVVAVMFLLASLPAGAQTTWFKYTGNPVMSRGPAGAWDDFAVIPNRVIQFHDTLKMWYSGSRTGNTFNIGYAWSTDGGITWTRHPSNPILTPTQTWEGSKVSWPYVIYINHQWQMWYVGSDFDIGYATSSDGIHWTKDASNPVFRHGSAGTWDGYGLGWPCVRGPDSLGRFKMWFEGWDAQLGTSQIGYAGGTNETNWTRGVTVNSVLRPVPGTWEPSNLRGPRVMFNGQFQMWYTGGADIRGRGVGYATSRDGTTWVKDTLNPVLAPGPADSRSWDAVNVMLGDILFDGTAYQMWYTGNAGSYAEVGYAVSPKGSTITLTPNSFIAVGSAVTIATHIDNPQDLSFYVYIDSLGSTRMCVDTLQLYDDGLHGDSLAGDGLFANRWLPSAERNYAVNLNLGLRGKKDLRFHLDNAASFTSIGPVKLEDVVFASDAAPHPGDTVVVRLVLKNHGASVSADSVTATISTVNKWVTDLTSVSPVYGTIGSGMTAETGGTYRFFVSPNCPLNTNLPFDLQISSAGIPRWRDGFVISVLPPWWRSKWAYGLYVTIAVGLFYGLWRLQARRLYLKHQREMEHFQLEKMKEVDQLKSRFFANISHEFRTPLTLIEGPLRQLKSGEFEGNAQEQYDLMLRNTQSLTRLVNQLLDLSRIDAGQMRLHAQQVDLCELVKGAAAAFESLATRKGVEYNVRVPEEPIMGWVDQDGVEKILVNLLSNALKFTERGGAVEVRIDLSPCPSPKAGEGGRGGEAIQVIVADTGIGIPADQVTKVFDRFYQVDGSQTREYAGTGIGLSLTKELVELHHGQITVESKVGCGSTFTVILPMSKEQWKPEEIAQTAEHQEAMSTREIPSDEGSLAKSRLLLDDADEHLPLLLIVEDNPDMRLYLRGIFGPEYRLFDSVNGRQGLEDAIESVPDLIISDVMMPELDGITLCTKLKNDERTSHIPVILLTARAEATDRISGLETGADDYVIKPFDARELLVRVKNLIEGRKKLREHFQKSGIVALDEVAVTSLDKQFVARAMGVLEKHLPDSSFTADQFALEMFVSRTQLNRKIRALTGLSSWHFVRKIRLHRGAELLRKRAGNIADVAYQVGYESPPRFTEAFHEEFGQTPSDFQTSHPA